MRFFLSEKTGFICRQNPVIIYDGEGLLFFFSENVTKDLFFNLPPGEFTTNNTLEKTVLPRSYKKFVLPKGNAVKKLPSEINVYFTNNPNKCTVDTLTGDIYFDNSFKDKPEYFITYVKFHEGGHFLYSGQGQRSERLCDKFAYNKMIEFGYNPQQIAHAQKVILSNRKEARLRKKDIQNLVNKSI